MQTKNGKAICRAMSLLSNNSRSYDISDHVGLFEITNTDGYVYYVTGGTSGFYGGAGNLDSPVISTGIAQGIYFGTDATPPSEDDYFLKSRITSGITASLVYTKFMQSAASKTIGISRTYLITNNSTSDITICEVGQVVRAEIHYYPRKSNTSNATYTLVDRTVLGEPVTIQPGSSAEIVYEMSVVDTTFDTHNVNGIVTAPFARCSDDELVAMLDAAAAGTIDLQADCGWGVGDARPIRMNYNGTDYVDLLAVIVGFDDVYNCGSVVRIFISGISTGFSPTTIYPDYGTGTMCTQILPAMADSLPDWIRDCAITYTVPYNNGSSGNTASGKLHLPSLTEVSPAVSRPGDGTKDPNYYGRRGRFASGVIGWYRATNDPYAYAQDAWQFTRTTGNDYACVFNAGGHDSTTSGNNYNIRPMACLGGRQSS